MRNRATHASEIRLKQCICMRSTTVTIAIDCSLKSQTLVTVIVDHNFKTLRTYSICLQRAQLDTHVLFCFLNITMILREKVLLVIQRVIFIELLWQEFSRRTGRLWTFDFTKSLTTVSSTLWKQGKIALYIRFSVFPLFDRIIKHGSL